MWSQQWHCPGMEVCSPLRNCRSCLSLAGAAQVTVTVKLFKIFRLLKVLFGRKMFIQNDNHDGKISKAEATVSISCLIGGTLL